MVKANYDSRPFPDMSWRQLESILKELAATPLQRAMVRHLIDGLRNQARYLTPGGILREIAIITLAVTDHLGGEAPMPAPP